MCALWYFAPTSAIRQILYLATERNVIWRRESARVIDPLSQMKREYNTIWKLQTLRIVLTLSHLRALHDTLRKQLLARTDFKNCHLCWRGFWAGTEKRPKREGGLDERRKEEVMHKMTTEVLSLKYIFNMFTASLDVSIQGRQLLYPPNPRCDWCVKVGPLLGFFRTVVWVLLRPAIRVL